MKKLPPQFYQRDPITVAQELLGQYLVHEIEAETRIGRIVEVEAYLGPHDLAAHSSKGRTARTEIMFGPGGYAYVYLIYGIHHCMNVVTEGEGQASAVLLRALEPVQNVHQRSNGPGLLCKAFDITRAQNGQDLQSSNFYLASPPEVKAETFSIVKRPRIGVDYAKEWSESLLRFYIKGNAFISRP